jgi:hypothetical protein
MRKLVYGFAALVIAAASASAAGAKSNSTRVYSIRPTSTFQAMGSQTRVVINVTKEPTGSIEPAHIHAGTCKHPGAVKFPLTDVVHGYSITILDVPISLAAVAGTSVNLHKSSAQLNVYVACGNISHHWRS